VEGKSYRLGGRTNFGIEKGAGSRQGGGGGRETKKACPHKREGREGSLGGGDSIDGRNLCLFSRRKKGPQTTEPGYRHIKVGKRATTIRRRGG